MNERIKELAEQANISIRNYYDESGSTPAELQKFAELIVKECTALVQSYMTRWPEDCELTKQIKEHFGVTK